MQKALAQNNVCRGDAFSRTQSVNFLVYLSVGQLLVFDTYAIVEDSLIGILSSIVTVDLESGVSPTSAKSIETFKAVFEALGHTE